MKRIVILVASCAAALLALFATDLREWSTRGRGVPETAPIEGDRSLEPLPASPAPISPLRSVAASATERQIGPEAPRAIFEVAHLDGSPIPNALVARIEDRPRLRGRTDASGWVSVETDERTPSDWVVTKAGYVPRQVRVNPVHPPPIRVQLERGWGLEGRVVAPDLQPVRSGIRVVAIDPINGLDPKGFKLSLEGLPVVATALTDDYGKFVLDGLSPHLGCRILAFGGGCLAFDPFGPALTPTTESPLEVVVWPVYCARILPVEVDGAPLRLGPDLEGSWYGPAQHLSPGLRSVPLHPRYLSAGFGVTEDEDPGPFGLTQIFIADQDLDYVEVAYELRFPGYRESWNRITVSRFTDRIESHRVELQDLGFGRGRVRVRLGEARDDLSRVLGGSRPCVLQLREKVRHFDLAMELDAFWIEAGLIDGIPHGKYEARIVAPHQLWRWPELHPIEIEVGDEPAELSVSLGTPGSLRLVVETGAGLEYHGPLRGGHTRSDAQEYDEFAFPCSPYFVPLLPVGNYQLAVYGSKVIHPENPQAIPFAIASGETTTLRIYLE